MNTLPAKLDLSKLASKAKTITTAANRKTGRIIFALDATQSRQAMWKTSAKLQHLMFDTAAAIGDLEVSLGYFRGHADCQFADFTRDTNELHTLMDSIHCVIGNTQIKAVLEHALTTHLEKPINAVVIVTDTFEEQSNLSSILHIARMLGDQSVPVFVFHETDTLDTEWGQIRKTNLEAIAKSSHGAYAKFTEGADKTLAELLEAVAAFATGGFKALEARGTATARLLIEQLKK